MANLKPLDNYQSTQWNNYLPPSIDQDKLNNLEQNLLLNRDTINEIIKNLGVKPNNVSIEDGKIYDNPVYETLIAHKNELARLDRDKVNLSKYNSDIGNMTNLKGGGNPSNLVTAINNRLRNDVDDDSGQGHIYTFKKLILSNRKCSSLAGYRRCHN